MEKVLIVNARGYKDLGADERRRFSERLDELGWRVDVLPTRWIETADQFIVRLRKGRDSE